MFKQFAVDLNSWNYLILENKNVVRYKKQDQDYDLLSLACLYFAVRVWAGG